jgi:hypothetical protein
MKTLLSHTLRVVSGRNSMNANGACFLYGAAVFAASAVSSSHTLHISYHSPIQAHPHLNPSTLRAATSATKLTSAANIK